ncbi:MAG TPA: hypothetical protein VF037_04900 [Gemmatimonadales bacterium]
MNRIVIGALLLAAVPADEVAAQGSGAPSGTSIDTALARAYFAEAAAVKRREAGALWGVPFDGALMFADPGTRAVVAERGDTAGILRRAGSVWTGTMPSDRNVANTAQEFGGVRWTTVVWPPPAGDGAEARARRAELFAHELWHGIQERAGIAVADPVNAHLDGRAGRVWLRLEARALARALETEGAVRKAALADAVAFRRARHAADDSIGLRERQLERHEGMASYTGLVLSGRDSAGMARRARELLASLDTAPHLGRSFAYATGPAYGVLLDGIVPGWRRRVVAGEGPAEILAKAIAARDPAPDELLVRARAFGQSDIDRAEASRESARAARTAELTRLLVDGPVIRLPFGQMQMQIDPNAAEPLGSAGTVYGAIRISDRWGVLDVKGGAVLLAADFSHAALPLPGGVSVGARGAVEGPGWVLTLAEGFRLAEGARPGDLAVTR